MSGSDMSRLQRFANNINLGIGRMRVENSKPEEIDEADIISPSDISSSICPSDKKMV